MSETKQELKRSADSQKETVRALSIQVSIAAKQALLSSYRSMYDIELNHEQTMAAFGEPSQSKKTTNDLYDPVSEWALHEGTQIKQNGN